jgi:SNF2 family DNA or RNA helicase
MGDFLPGIEISARGLRWALVDSLPVGEQTLYRVRGLEGAFQGIEIDLLSPLEELIPIASEINPQKAAPLKNWLIYHQAFLLEQALGSTAILSIQPGRLKTEPYQIVPLMRALKMSRPRLLLCDDVGLGKTIQAALIITELMVRKFAHRVLIVSPAGPLLRQWKTELLERFGLRVEVMDRAKLEAIKKKSELGANPFDQIPLGLVSIDFLKQERILEQLERTSYDIIIIDEAHHCSDTGGTQEYEDSLRRNLAQVLANRCDTLLLLTATPHNGNDRSLASLLELLDLSLVDSRGALRGDKYKLHMVRRLKKHIKDPITGEPKFKERTVIPVPVEAKEDKYKYFLEFQKAFLDFIAPELRSAFRSKRYGDVLAFISLLKRSVSTVYSCLETLKTVGSRFEGFLDETTENQARKKERVKTLKEYQKRVEQFGTVSFEEEQDQQNLIAEDIADQLASIEREVRRGARVLTKTRSIKEAIYSIIESGERALLYDPKLDALVDEIGQIKKEEPSANILIFTEYTDSQAKILERLKAENLGKILSMFGGDPEAARIKTINQFMDENNIILVCTDAAAEGLNLHKRCHHLIHLELPFNPNRLEQRNGRIDRYGQEKIPIVRYLYLRNTFEDRILLRLIAKYERQKSKLLLGVRLILRLKFGKMMA